MYTCEPGPNWFVWTQGVPGVPKIQWLLARLLYFTRYTLLLTNPSYRPNLMFDRSLPSHRLRARMHLCLDKSTAIDSWSFLLIVIFLHTMPVTVATVAICSYRCHKPWWLKVEPISPLLSTNKQLVSSADRQAEAQCSELKAESRKTSELERAKQQLQGEKRQMQAIGQGQWWYYAIIIDK